jgi:hypothetical protein
MDKIEPVLLRNSAIINLLNAMVKSSKIEGSSKLNKGMLKLISYFLTYSLIDDTLVDLNKIKEYLQYYNSNK